MSALSDRAREAADALWEAQHAHPFVRGIADGTLDRARFADWVRQDWVFLVDYAKVLAYATARAPRLDWQRRLAEVTHVTLSVEMGGHRSYAASLGIAEAALDAEPAWPATAAYTDFLLRHAASGSFEELVAALLPCMWGFSEVGTRMAASGTTPEDPALRAWIAMYADPDFAQLAAWCREVFDALGAAAPGAVQDRMVELFVASSRHELAFWEQAWAGAPSAVA